MPVITPSEIDIQIGQIIGQENSQLFLFRIKIGPLELVVFDEQIANGHMETIQRAAGHWCYIPIEISTFGKP